MTRRSMLLPAAIVVATVVAAVVVLVAGGPDRGAVATMLLVGVPLLIAIGGASDQGWRTVPRPDVKLGIRLVSILPTLLIQVALVVLIGWKVVTAVAGGDAVCGVALIPVAMLAGWRAWEVSRRLGPGRP